MEFTYEGTLGTSHVRFEDGVLDGTVAFEGHLEAKEGSLMDLRQGCVRVQFDEDNCGDLDPVNYGFVSSRMSSAESSLTMQGGSEAQRFSQRPREQLTALATSLCIC